MSECGLLDQLCSMVDEPPYSDLQHPGSIADKS